MYWLRFVWTIVCCCALPVTAAFAQAPENTTTDKEKLEATLRVIKRAAEYEIHAGSKPTDRPLELRSEAAAKCVTFPPEACRVAAAIYRQPTTSKPAIPGPLRLRRKNFVRS